VGSYCPGGQENDPTTEPVPCPAGTYNPSIKAVDIVNCHQCEKGFACNQTGMDDSTILPCKTGKDYCCCIFFFLFFSMINVKKFFG
jgi:hypothetical protein